MNAAVRRWLIRNLPARLHPHLRSLQRYLTLLVGSILRRFPGSSRRFGPPRRVMQTVVGYVAAQNRAQSDGTAYRELYSSERLVRLPPLTLDAEVHPAFRREMQRVTLPAGIAILPKGRVITRTGTVIGSDDTLIGDVSDTALPASANAHPIFLSLKLPPLTRIGGNIAVLTTHTSNIYYHWIIDAIPRLHLLERSGIAWDRIVVPSAMSFQSEALALLGLAPEQCITDPRLHLEAERLIVPSLPGVIGNPQLWACRFVRDRLNVLPGNGGPQRIYVSRAKAGTRRFINEHELIGVLKEFGFVCIFLEDLSIREQIGLFADAEIIVAAHGSGLANLVFCREGAQVVEILSPNYVNVMYWALSNQVGLRYAYLCGQAKDGSSSLRGRRVHEDMWVDSSKLRQLLLQVIPQRPHRETPVISPAARSRESTHCD